LNYAKIQDAILEEIQDILFKKKELMGCSLGTKPLLIGRLQGMFSIALVIL
jgi:hypothetical protein